MSKTFEVENDHQTPTSRSALVNGAAKDDAVVLTEDHTFTLAQLLANDPRCAKFVSFTGDGISYDPETHIFTASDDATGFDYVIRMANGTYSHAHVDLEQPEVEEAQAGGSLFLENFGSYTTTDGFAVVDLSTGGWTSTGGATEVVKDGYQGIVGNDGGYWLDTQATPGGVDITHAVTDANGGKAQLTISVAAQQFGSFETTGTLDVVWNGVLVDTITVAELGDFNTFHEFSWVVDSVAGANAVEIHDTGPAVVVGFALDAVQVNDWIV